MKRILTLGVFSFVLFCLFALNTHASSNSHTRVGQAFIAMPDSLLPYLSRNNKLDLLDFIASGMKAEVTNLLGGKSEIEFATEDSLSIILSPALRLSLSLSDDSIYTVRRSFQTLDGFIETTEEHFDAQWHQMRRKTLKKSTILNYYKDIRNKD